MSVCGMISLLFWENGRRELQANNFKLQMDAAECCLYFSFLSSVSGLVPSVSSLFFLFLNISNSYFCSYSCEDYACQVMIFFLLGILCPELL